MGRSKKLVMMVGVGALVVVAGVGLIGLMMYNSKKSEVTTKIKNIESFNEPVVRSEESLLLNYRDGMIPDPTRPASVIERVAESTGKTRIERIYSDSKVSQALKSFDAKIRPARLNSIVTIGLIVGGNVTGRYTKKVKNAAEGWIVSINGKSYKMKSEIDSKFHFLFDDQLAKRELIRLKSQAKNDLERKKTEMIAQQTDKLRREFYQKNHYVMDQGYWQPAKSVLEKRVELRHADYMAERDRQIEEILTKNKFMGKKFTLKDLGLSSTL